MPRPMQSAVKRAVRAYQQLAKEMPKGYKPSLSAIARSFKIAKSSLWYALNK